MAPKSFSPANATTDATIAAGKVAVAQSAMEHIFNQAIGGRDVLDFFTPANNPIVAFVLAREFIDAQPGTKGKVNFELSQYSYDNIIAMLIRTRFNGMGLTTVSNGSTVMVTGANEPALANLAAYRYIQQADLKFNNMTICELAYEANIATLEVSAPSGIRLSEMDSYIPQLGLRQLRGRQSQVFYTRLNLWCNKTLTVPLRLQQTSLNQCVLSITPAKLANCIVRPGGDDATDVQRRADYTSKTIADDWSTVVEDVDTLSDDLFVSDNAPDLDLYVEGVYFNPERRNQLANESTVDIIEQYHYSEETVTGNAKANEYSDDVTLVHKLTFQSSFKELLWYARNDGDDDDGTASEFLRVADPITTLGDESIKESTIIVGGGKALQHNDGLYYRFVQPLLYHTAFPRLSIYYFSLNCLLPEKLQYTGSVNTGMFKDMLMKFVINGRLFELGRNTVTVGVIGVGINILAMPQGAGVFTGYN